MGITMIRSGACRRARWLRWSISAISYAACVNLGYGYYERQKVDLVEDPAWAILRQEYRTLDGVDLARFTFELDEAVESISQLVSTIFASSS